MPPFPTTFIDHRPDRRRAVTKKLDIEAKMAQLDFHSVSPAMNAALQAPSRFRNAFSKESTFSVIWDSGASVSISPNKDDFVGEIRRPNTITQLNGIAKGLRIEGQGEVRWSVYDTTGRLRHLTLPAYYVPKIKVRLISTTSLLQTYVNETIKVEAHQLTLSGIPDCPERTAVTARVNPDNNLPTSDAHREKDLPIAVAVLNATISAVNDANLNLTEPEKELLRWHYRLGHMGFKRIQFIMRTGVLTRSNNKRHLHQAACKISSLPKCAACQYGKQHRRPAPGKTTAVVRDRAGILKEGHLLPGQQISIDHFLCSTEGRLFTSAGKTAKDEMYVGGCLFNDHASGFVHVEFQSHLTTHETLMSKENYELMCRDNGVVPQSYLSDNAKCFTAKEFAEKLSLFEQIVRFAGVGAHHHNGNAERSIQTIMSIARTMMLHAAIHWPDVADATLWPMAVTHAVYLHNHMPSLETGLSPVDLFTKSRWQQHKFHDLHVWGCPSYVLEKSMADGKKLPRWKPRSIRCMNVGLSPKHASTVPLVLNVSTGYITAQFHVVFDDWFTTVATTIENLPDFNSPEWAKVFGESTYQYPFDEDEENETIIIDDQLSVSVDQIRPDSVAAAMDKSIAVLPVDPIPTTVFPTTPQPSIRSPPMSSTRETTPLLTPRPEVYDEVASIAPNRTPIQPQSLFPLPSWQPPIPTLAPPTPPSSTREQTAPPNRPSPSPIPIAPVAAAPPPPTQAPSIPSEPRPTPPSHPTFPSQRRSTRQRTAPSRLGYDGDQGRGYFAQPSAWIFPECGLLPPPLVYKATPSDPDTLTYDAAMSDKPMDVVKWLEAAAKEIASLEKNGTWIEVDASEARSRILPGTYGRRTER
jgi:GAG-pre-integrase domain